MRVCVKQAESQYKSVSIGDNSCVSDFQSTEAYDYLTKMRQVNQLVHFTPIENVKGIMKHGILPHSSVPETAIVLDRSRLDGHNDCSCFSVTFPNYKMLYCKRRNYNQTFAILGVDPQIIADKKTEDVLYYMFNAAKSGACGFKGVSGAEKMFYDRIPQLENNNQPLRTLLHLPSNYTTNPQAEILIRGTVPKKYIKCIYVENQNAKDRLMELLGGRCKIPITVEPELFKGRHDHMYWRSC